MKTVLIAGANGLIARYLSDYLSSEGWKVVGLARRDEGLHPSCKYVHWDGKTLGDWQDEFEQCDAIINLTGKSVNCRFTPENRELILNSRVDSTRVIGRAIESCENPPKVWINASGANYYSASRGHAQDESGERGGGYMADVVAAWEDSLFSANVSLAVRRIALRTSMVLADEPKNPLRTFRTLSKLGVGGKISDGKQMVSWIHIDDVCRSIEWLIDHEDISGPVNITSPDPISNSAFMHRFRQSVNMPIGLPAAAWMVKIGAYFLQIEPQLILDSLWITPTKLLNHGYDFKYPNLKPENW